MKEQPKRSPHSLADYWGGIEESFRARFAGVKDFLRHPSSGSTVEEYFRNLVSEYLPKRYTVASGFVVNAAGDRSDHIDLIVADLSEIPPLCVEPPVRFFAAESVVAAVEVTAAPKSRVRQKGNTYISKFEADTMKLAKLRQIAQHREYRDSFPITARDAKEKNEITFVEFDVHVRLPPRCFLITCGDEWAKRDTFERNVVEGLHSLKEKGLSPWLNAVLSMRHGMLHFKPHHEYETQWLTKNALLEFILFLNNVVATNRTHRIDIRKYRPSTPKE